MLFYGRPNEKQSNPTMLPFVSFGAPRRLIFQASENMEGFP